MWVHRVLKFLKLLTNTGWRWNISVYHILTIFKFSIITEWRWNITGWFWNTSTFMEFSAIQLEVSNFIWHYHVFYISYLSHFNNFEITHNYILTLKDVSFLDIFYDSVTSSQCCVVVHLFCISYLSRFSDFVISSHCGLASEDLSF